MVGRGRSSIGIGQIMLTGVEKRHVQKEKETLKSTERWRRLYMSWFYQIPLSLGSSCYRPNSRGPLLLLTPSLLAQQSPPPHIHSGLFVLE